MYDILPSCQLWCAVAWGHIGYYNLRDNRKMILSIFYLSWLGDSGEHRLWQQLQTTFKKKQHQKTLIGPLAKVC